jgi:hypothetical protein
MALAITLIGLAGCSGDSASTPTTPVPVTTAPVTTAAPGTTAVPSTSPATSEPTTVSSTAVPVTTTPPPPTTTEPTASTTEVCVAPIGTATVEDGYPSRMSALVGRDIRTGGHGCFERVVLELEGDGGLPGYRVGYVDDPVRLSPSDLVVDIAGEATLMLSVASWMTNMDGDGYSGPTDITPTNVGHILELRLVENFEGMHAWAIGLDRRRDFAVSTLADPPRIVIDVASS